MFDFLKNKRTSKTQNNNSQNFIEKDIIAPIDETVVEDKINDKNEQKSEILKVVNNVNKLNYSEEVCVDAKMETAIKTVCDAGYASTSLIQRRLECGYARASRIIDDMEQLGVIGPHRGSQPREVLITYGEWLEFSKTVKIRTISNNEVQLTHYFSVESVDEYKNVGELIKNRLNIEVDYSNNGYYFNKLSNFVVPNSTDKIQNDFINNVISFANVEAVKLILINETPSYDEYKGMPHLLLPIITEYSKSTNTINWLVQEMNDRLKLFSLFECKSIESYNKLIEKNQEYMKENQAYESEEGEIVQPVLEINGLGVKKEKLPFIVVVVNEFYYMNNNSDIDEKMIRLLLNSTICGIYFVLFSKFSVKNLTIGKKEDLLEIVGEEDLKKIFYNQQQKKINISDNYDGYRFEAFCGELLKNEGFTNIRVTKSSNDYGADVLAEKDDVKYAIQCKRYSNSVGLKSVQEVIASKSVYNCHVAVVMTNSYFTKSAIELAAKNGVLLWGGDKLSKMIEKYNKDEC